MMITEEIKNMILGVTGADRTDCIANVAKALNGNFGCHQVYSGTSNNIEWNGMVIDLTTKKKKGVQVVKSFMAWEKGDRKTIKMYF